MWVPRQSQSPRSPSYEFSSLYINEVLSLSTVELSVKSKFRGDPINIIKSKFRTGQINVRYINIIG
jgi:hypothetical protein